MEPMGSPCQHSAASKCGAGEVYEPHAMRIRHRKGATMKKIMFVLAFSVVLVFLEGLIPERRRAKAVK